MMCTNHRPNRTQDEGTSYPSPFCLSLFTQVFGKKISQVQGDDTSGRRAGDVVGRVADRRNGIESLTLRDDLNHNLQGLLGDAG